MKNIITFFNIVFVIILIGCGKESIKNEESDKIYGIKSIYCYATPGSMITEKESIEVTLILSGDYKTAKYTIDGSNPKESGIDFKFNEKIKINPSENTILNLYVSDGDNEIRNSYYYKKGKEPKQISNFNEIRMYEIMVEAFQDGDNLRGYGTGYGPSSHMGDIRGIINSLDYIKSLNVNAIWITPIFTSESVEIKLRATGYYADDYFNIDPNFGTNEEFRELVNEVHKRGMYIFLDGVFGHHGKAKITGVEDFSENDEIGRVCKFPESIEFYKRVATYWIDNYEIDGWRVDQANQLNQNGINYWKEIRKAVEARCNIRKNQGNQWGTLGYIVGEIWDGKGTEIVNKGYSQEGLKSCFDFPTRYSLVQVLATQENMVQSWGKNQPASKLNETLNSLATYPDYAKPNLMITNHDLVRFGDLIERAGFGYGAENEDYWLRHKAAFSFMAAYTGPVTIYYGDEIGEEVEGFINNKDMGYSDGDSSRTDGKISGFNSKEENLINYVSDIMEMRKNHPALWNGKRKNLIANENIFADLKTELESQEKIVYILNKSTSDIEIVLSNNLIEGKILRNLITGEVVEIRESKFNITAKRISGEFYIVVE
jgi:cyclomaltodextrinase / maltogenic alpha-amylase / neopullulanase